MRVLVHVYAGVSKQVKESNNVLKLKFYFGNTPDLRGLTPRRFVVRGTFIVIRVAN